jgi:hypothetical protein
MEKSIESLKWTMTVTLDELQRDVKRLKKLVSAGEIPSTPETKISKAKKPVRTISVDTRPLLTLDQLTEKEKDALKISADNEQYYHNNWKKAKTRTEQDNAMRDCIAYVSVAQEKIKQASGGDSISDDHFVFTDPEESGMVDDRYFLKIETIGRREEIVKKELCRDDVTYNYSPNWERIVDGRIQNYVVSYLYGLLRMVAKKKDKEYDYTKDSELVLSENAIMNGFCIPVTSYGVPVTSNGLRVPSNSYLLLGPFLKNSKSELFRSINLCLSETLLNFIENKPLFDGWVPTSHKYDVQIVGDNLIKIKITYEPIEGDDDDDDDDEDDDDCSGDSDSQ